jgi:adenylyltransferase/sulfurtransferase
VSARTETFALAREPHCPLCGSAATVHSPAADLAMDNQKPDSQPPGDADAAYPAELSVHEAKQRLDSAPQRTLLLDVREPWETAIVAIAGAKQIPMRQVPEQLAGLPTDRQLLVLCHHGARSQRVAEYLRAHGFRNVSNVAGGIAAWAEQIDRSLPQY